MTNCVNCGAAIVGSTCAFCGTRYDIVTKRHVVPEVIDNTRDKFSSMNYSGWQIETAQIASANICSAQIECANIAFVPEFYPHRMGRKPACVLV